MELTVQSFYSYSRMKMNAVEVTHLKRVFRATIGVIKRSIKEVVAVVKCGQPALLNVWTQPR